MQILENVRRPEVFATWIDERGPKIRPPLGQMHCWKYDAARRFTWPSITSLSGIHPARVRLFDTAVGRCYLKPWERHLMVYHGSAILRDASPKARLPRTRRCCSPSRRHCCYPIPRPRAPHSER